jgi:hypothetical protein
LHEPERTHLYNLPGNIAIDGKTIRFLTTIH